MKLVDIEAYKGKVIASHTYCGVNKLIEVDALEEISEQEIVKPYLDKIRAEIEKKCDRINSLSSVLPYTAHREIQELLCEIMELCKSESEGKE